MAVLYMTGEMPVVDVDHINRVRDDNRWINLRPCNASQNAANTIAKPSNKSGVKGVSFDAGRQKWLAQVRIKGKKTNLGRFDSLEDAALAYKKAATTEFGPYLR